MDIDFHLSFVICHFSISIKIKIEHRFSFFIFQCLEKNENCKINCRFLFFIFRFKKKWKLNTDFHFSLFNLQKKWMTLISPCGFRPFDFDSKLKIENQKFKIVIFNVWFLKNWKSQIYNLNRQFLFLRNIKLKNNFQCFENQKLKIENGQLVVFISCF